MDNIKKDLLEEYHEALLKLAMDNFSIIKGKEFDLENKKIRDDKNLSISKNQRKKINRLLNLHLAKQNIGIFMKSTLNTLKTVSVFIVLFITIFGISIINVEAIRIKVLNLVLETQKEYTLIKLTDNKNGNILGNSLYINWENSYAPTYIPHNYTIQNISNDGGKVKFIEYINKNTANKPITFIEMSTEAKGNVDTEDAKVVNIKIHNYDGILIEKNNLVSIIWHNNEYLFDLSGYEKPDEMLKIAESVKLLK